LQAVVQVIDEITRILIHVSSLDIPIAYTLEAWPSLASH
jgi:hypothetical protein